MSDFFLPKAPDDPTAGTYDPVNISVFGKTIPLMFGAARILCAPIWAAPVITADDGTRTLTFAVMAGKKDPLSTSAVIMHIWLDGILAYNSDGTPTNSSQELKFTFYDGSEDQGIDPLIAAVEGDNNTPAFRDRMYLVIQDWIVPIGSKFPEVTVEILQRVSTSTNRYVYAYDDTTHSMGGPGVGFGLCFSVSLEQDLLFTLENSTRRVFSYSIAGQHKILDFLPLLDGHEIYPIGMASRELQGWYGHCPTTNEMAFFSHLGELKCRCAAPDGYLATSFRVSNDAGFIPAYEFVALSSFASVFKWFIRNYPSGTLVEADSMTTSANAQCNPVIVDHRKWSTPAVAGAPEVKPAIYLYGKWVCAYHAAGAKVCVSFFAGYHVDSTAISAVIGTQVLHHSDGTVTSIDQSASTSHAEIIDLSAYGNHIQMMFLDPHSRWLACLVGANDAVATWVKLELPWARLGSFSGSAPSLVGITATPAILATHSTSRQFNLLNVELTAIQGTPTGQTEVAFEGASSGVTNFTVMDMATGTIRDYPTGTFHDASTLAPIGDSSSTFTGRITWSTKRQGLWYMQIEQLGRPGFVSMLDPGSGDATMVLGDYFHSLARLADFSDDEIDAASVTDVVTGSIINVATDFFTLAAKVASLFRVDILESEGEIKFFRHTRSVTDRTVTDFDLAPVANDLNDGSLLVKERIATASLPQTLQVSYLDKDNSFEVGGQIARRTQFPFRTTAGTGTTIIDVPLAMSASDALYWVEYTLYDLWAEALQITARLSTKHLDLEPGDWVDISTTNDGNYLVKIAELQVNADKSINLIGSTVLAVSPDNLNINDIVVASGDVQYSFPAGGIRVALIDNFTPYSQTGGETDVKFYVYANAVSDHVAYLTPTTYVSGRVPGASIFGTLTVAMPAIDVAETSTDTQTITGKFTSAPPAGTDATFLEGSTSVAVGTTGKWEMIAYRDVTANADGTHTLSHLSRGLRGTDTQLPASAGATILVFPGSSSLSMAYDFAKLGTSGTLKSNYAGRSTDGDSAISTAFDMNGGNLKPWAPVHVTATLSGSDVVLAWFRRDRAYTTLHDGDPTVPMSELLERYDLDIYNNAGTTVVRTLTDLTAATYTYLAASIAADAVTVSSTLKVGVYQKSQSIAARGYGRVVVCPVS